MNFKDLHLNALLSSLSKTRRAAAEGAVPPDECWLPDTTHAIVPGRRCSQG